MILIKFSSNTDDGRGARSHPADPLEPLLRIAALPA
jgi:hypothetical protein